MADVDWGSAEQQLKQKSGQWYDPSELEDLKRNASYGAGDGANDVDSWINRISSKAQLRGGNEANSTYQANGQGGTTTGPTGKVNGPSGSGGSGGFAQQWGPPTAPAGPTQADIETKAKTDALYGRLLADSNQSLAIDRNDPIIRAQADAYAANEERARRNYLSDTAESEGQYTNMQGERRMAAERMGQRTGANEAALMGNELTARRAAIQDRLHSMQGMLSAEQVQNLQRELSLMDNAIKEKQIAAGIRGQDLGQDQFLRDLALRENNQTEHWKYANTYGL